MHPSCRLAWTRPAHMHFRLADFAAGAGISADVTGHCAAPAETAADVTGAAGGTDRCDRRDLR